MGAAGFVSRVREELRDRGEARLGDRGTFWGRFAVASWRWSLQLCKFDDDPRWVLRLFCLWVTLGRAKTAPKDCMLDSWGVTADFGSRCVHLNWGHRCKILHFPWTMEFVGKEVMRADGSFVTLETAGRWPKWLTGYYRRYRRADGRLTPAYSRRGPVNTREEVREHLDSHTATPPADEYRQAFPYRYTLRNGTVQERTATVTVDRMTWCWRAFYRFGVWFPKKVRTSIDVRFSDEVGEESGSWKGGCVGCGYEMNPGETPEQTLRRMERERKFR